MGTTMYEATLLPWVTHNCRLSHVNEDVPLSNLDLTSSVLLVKA